MKPQLRSIETSSLDEVSGGFGIPCPCFSRMGQGWAPSVAAFRPMGMFGFPLMGLSMWGQQTGYPMSDGYDLAWGGDASEGFALVNSGPQGNACGFRPQFTGWNGGWFA